MDTLEFLTRILPETGVYYLCIINKDGRVAHKPYTTIQSMANAAKAFDTKSDVSIYHACAAYKEERIETLGKPQYRVPANHLSAKSFWVDIDCGAAKVAKGDGYLLQIDATRAILTFARQLGLPDPMIVSSGHGVHAYWVLNEAISPTRWFPVAEALRAALAFNDVRVDTGITADFARILRPVGTTNKKQQGKTVKLMRDAVPTDIDSFEQILLQYVTDNVLDIDPPDYDRNLNSDLTGHLQADIPSWADDVANRCQQVAKMRDTKGDVGYEHWRGVIGIIKFCEEGIDLAHAWSAERATTGHAQLDVDKMYNTWNSSPTTCSFFEKNNAGGCQGCAFKDEGKFKSPIVLGRREAVTVAVAAEVVKNGAVISTNIPALPKSYSVRKGVLHRQTIDAEGIIHEHAISTTLFYPRTRIQTETGKYALAIRAHLPREGVKDFEISQGTLASSADLQKALADYQIVTTHNKDAGMHLTAYMKDWLEKLKQESDEQNTYQNFGWHDDGRHFLLGDRMYHRDGTVREVLVGANARAKLDNFPHPKGELAEWTEAIHALYQHKGQEYRQFMIASSLGAVLTPLCSDPLYKGLVVSLVGETGLGKTTLARAALSVFGDPEKMSVKKATGATVNARYLLMGTYCNVPLLIDELTNIEADQFSEFCYCVSMGEDKVRLTVTKGSGVGFAETRTWATPIFVTANADLHALLASHNANSAAEAVRVIQIKLDDHIISTTEGSAVKSAVRKMERSQGTAADALLRYIVSHRPAVEAIMFKWAARIEKDVPEAKFRFYRNHAECTFAALEIAGSLGIVDFDIEALYTYTLGLFSSLSATIARTNSLTPEDALNSMLTEFSNRFIVSDGYRDKRGEPVQVLPRVIDEPVGRYILGTKQDPQLEGRLYLSVSAIRDWCADNRMTYAAVMGAADALNVMIPMPKDNRFFLGRGTSQVVGQTRCICLDYGKLQAALAGITPLTPVTNLNFVQGKKP